jgi:hypothetical protein
MVDPCARAVITRAAEQALAPAGGPAQAAGEWSKTDLSVVSTKSDQDQLHEFLILNS